jgi:cytochrome c biogenesis protein CcdA
LPLGIVLALGFCPVSATIFFVDLLTIAGHGGSHVAYPALYAMGAALPVLAFAAALGAGSAWLGLALNRTQQVQGWLNRAAGGVLLVIGIYYALKFNFGILPL